MIHTWKNFNENVDRYSQYSRDIDQKLKDYAEISGDDWIEIKNYFREQADPYNMKTPNEALDAYFKLVEDFLESSQFEEE